MRGGLSVHDVGISILLFAGMAGAIVLLPPGSGDSGPGPVVSGERSEQFAVVGGFERWNGLLRLEDREGGLLYLPQGIRHTVTLHGTALNGSGSMELSLAGTSSVLKSRVTPASFTLSTPVLPANRSPYVGFRFRCDVEDTCYLRIDNITATPYRGQEAVHMGENWYRKLAKEHVAWGLENPALFAYIPENTAIIQYTLRSHNEQRTINLSINSRPRTQLTVPPTTTQYTTVLEPGHTTLTFHTDEPCTPISTDDPRCVTIGITNITRVIPPAAGVAAGANVQEDSGMYRMRRNATLYANGSGSYILHLDAKTIGDTTRLRIFKDGIPVTETRVDAFGGPVTTPLMHIDGLTTFTFQTHCPERCELITASDIMLEPFDEQPDTLLYRFGSNWYRKVAAEDYRWSNGNATMYVYSYGNRSEEKTLWVAGKAFAHPRNITYVWNGEPVGTRTVRETDFKIINNRSGTFHGENKYGLPVTLTPGENTLTVQTLSSCTSMGAANNNSDIRCSVFGFKRMYLTRP